MRKVLSEDPVRRALARIDEAKGLRWLQNHLDYCTAPLLGEPWVLDVDSAVKTLYGHQEGAEIGYNPREPGRLLRPLARISHLYALEPEAGAAMGIDSLGEIKAFVIIRYSGANYANPNVFHRTEDRVLLLGRQSIRTVIKVYTDHYIIGVCQDRCHKHQQHGSEKSKEVGNLLHIILQSS